MSACEKKSPYRAFSLLPPFVGPAELCRNAIVVWAITRVSPRRLLRTIVFERLKKNEKTVSTRVRKIIFIFVFFCFCFSAQFCTTSDGGPRGVGHILLYGRVVNIGRGKHRMNYLHATCLPAPTFRERPSVRIYNRRFVRHECARPSRFLAR